ncbi:MAG: HAMP domain-containing sensor histidine kinase [Eubacteriales bacterium]|nr:HAMP domain-containing sensor histidine kinase [Eubacteriales bacterium]
MTKIIKTRILFVISSVIFLSIMLGLIIFFSYKKSFSHMTNNADKILEQILNNDEKSDSLEHYFIVKVDRNHKVENVQFVNVRKKDIKDKILEYAKNVMSEDSDKGYIDGYRYMLKKDNRDRSVTIAFLARYGNEAMLKQNIKSMIQFSVIGVIVVAIILVFVSKLVVWPIEEEERRQKAFISAASHSLKTPLTIISTSADLLKDENDNEWIDIIKEQTNYMTDMTNNLILLTKLEAGNEYDNMIEFPISDVFSETLHSFSPLAESRKQTVSYDIEENISYVGNENDIRQLFTLLLDNAHKYAGENGMISVQLKSKKNEINLIMKNTSIKYDKKELDNLFDRFYRGSSVKEKGFGIGLYVVKVIAEKHKGSVEAHMEGDNIIVFNVKLKMF